MSGVRFLNGNPARRSARRTGPTLRSAHRAVLLRTALLVVALPALLGLARPALAARMTAQIHPSEIPLGQSARLTVTITDVQAAPAPRVPQIDGLRIQSLGQTTSVQIVNGAVRAEVQHSYVVTPTRTGTFTIPSLSVDLDGERLTTSPLVLKVLDAGAVPRRGIEPRPRPGGGRDGAPLSLQVRAPDRELFVGELLPLELELWVRDGVRVTEASPPTFAGNAFTVSRPQSEPAQRREVVDGVRYTVATFPVAISPVTAGEHPFQAVIDVTAYMPGRWRFGGFIDDPFFDSFFGGGTPKRIPIESTARTVRVLPLPDKGRPPDFSGAIGRFTISASASPTNVTLGDPITLTTIVEGQGNFDRLEIPELEASADWKTYAASTRLETDDSLGYAGKKIAEQAIVPRHAGASTIPAQSFSYFDPDERRYVTRTTEPIALAVAAAPSALAAVRPRAATGGTGSVTIDADLAPNRITPGELAPGGGPVVTQPWFFALQAVPLVALGAGALWARRRDRLLRDPAYHRRIARQKRAGAEREAMRRAVAAGDAPAFFAAARRAVQAHLATDPGRAAESLTPAEMERLLGDDPALAANLRAVVEEADRVAYSGAERTGGELRQWEERVTTLLEALERREARARR